MRAGLRTLAATIAPTALTLAALAALALPARAGGPLGVCYNAPVKYPGAGTVTLHYDQGALGPRSNSQANALVTAAVANWTNVTTASVAIARGSDLPEDVTAANYGAYLGNFGDGRNPVLYDTDGSIIDALIGAGAKNNVLGFAGSAWTDNGSACQYVEGQAVISGFISVSDATMRIVMAHEIGHLIGMDHTQIDSQQGLAQAAYPLMYPIAYRGTDALHEDDAAAVSALYPDASLGATYGQITGTFTQANGTPIRGANLWARETTTGKHYSVVSDYLKQNTGYFRLLLPAGTYNLYAGAIRSGFTGGSSVGPYSESAGDPSFQPPLYVGGVAMSLVALGGGFPTAIAISAGCAATATFKIDGTGSIGGNCTPPPPTEVFPPNAAIPAGWVTPAGTTPWTVASDQADVGTYSLKSGATAHGGQSAVEMTANFAAGTVSFTRKVSSEPTWDVLRFYIDGVQLGEWSGEVAWGTVSNAIASGVHTLRWTYSKDANNSVNGDAAWIDSVSLPASTTYFPLTVTKSGTGTGIVSASPGLIHCGATCADTFAPGTLVQLTAAPSPGSAFTVWGGACSGNGTVCQVTLDAVKTVSAQFDLIPIYTLTVNKTGAGTGTVTSSPAGIQCGATCAADFEGGTVITLTATPAGGSLFTGWSGGSCSGTGPCIFAIGANATRTANFGVSSTLDVSVTGSGTVTSSPAGITCPSDCTQAYATGTAVTLTATPAANQLFAGWAGACTGLGSCVVNLSSPAGASVSATFVGQSNVALAANGGVASASSSLGAGTPVAAVNNGDRTGMPAGSGGTWADGTPGAYPDTVQVVFAGPRLVNRVVVVTTQDNFGSAVDPSDAMTFSLYGITAFTVEAWNGSAWTAVGTASGNNLVKRTFNFATVLTDRIRVSITATVDGYSRIAEIEAYGAAPPAPPPPPAASMPGDFNADGKSDLLWLNTDGRYAMWLMNSLAPSATSEILAGGTGFNVAHIADFDGDGKADLFFQHADGRAAIWLMNGTAPASTVQVLAAGTGWTAVHVADLDGDGKADIVWQHTDGSVAAWLMNGTAMSSGSGILGAGSGWSVAHVGDFDADGKSDLYWQHTDGRAAIWLMNGLTPTGTNQILNATSGWSAAHVADLSGDGKADIVWQHTDGSVAVWLMNGAAMASGAGILGAGTGWSVVRTADFDGDGKRDLYWQHTDGRAAIWLMNGLVPASTAQILNAASGWSLRRVADLNGDGKADIVWVHTDGSVAAWLMNGAAMASGSGILGPASGWSVSQASP